MLQLADAAIDQLALRRAGAQDRPRRGADLRQPLQQQQPVLALPLAAARRGRRRSRSTAPAGRRDVGRRRTAASRSLRPAPPARCRAPCRRRRGRVSSIERDRARRGRGAPARARRAPPSSPAPMMATSRMRVRYCNGYAITSRESGARHRRIARHRPRDRARARRRRRAGGDHRPRARRICRRRGRQIEAAGPGAVETLQADVRRYDEVERRDRRDGRALRRPRHPGQQRRRRHLRRRRRR